MDVSSRRSTGTQQYRDLQNEVGGGGTSEKDGTGDEVEVELESEGEAGSGARLVILDKKAKKEKKKINFRDGRCITRQNQKKPKKQRLKA